MPALFSQHRRRAAAIVDRLMGEPVRITPRLALPKRPLAGDGERAIVELVARFTLKPKEIELEGQRRGTDLGGFTLLQGAEAKLIISPAEASKLAYDLRQGDLITLLAPELGLWPGWSVLAQLPSSTGQRVVSLTREA